MRLRHLLQYLNTTRVFGLVYLFLQKEKAIGLSEFTVFSDSSFAPARKDPKVDIRFYSLMGECAILCTGTPPGRRRSQRARQKLGVPTGDGFCHCFDHERGLNKYFGRFGFFAQRVHVFCYLLTATFVSTCRGESCNFGEEVFGKTQPFAWFCCLLFWWHHVNQANTREMLSILSDKHHKDFHFGLKAGRNAIPCSPDLT